MFITFAKGPKSFLDCGHTGINNTDGTSLLELFASKSEIGYSILK